MKQLLTMESLTNDEVFQLIDRALEIKAGASSIHRPDLFIANLFFESSTRTKLSFEIAEKHLGLKVVDFELSTSSVNKGESLYDTCKTLEMIGTSMLVIRHPEQAYYQQLEGLRIPIINGGDGSGEHPSQSLLDLMTLQEHFGRIEGLNIIIVGDIKNSRVARSNYHMLTRLGAQVRFVCPDLYKDVTLGEVVQFDDVVEEVDVCMLLRVQHERHDGSQIFDKNSYHLQYGLTSERYHRLKETAVVMHPAPINRGVEIADELVEKEKSLIFPQMKNGMFMRQAILEKIIQENDL